MKLCVVIPCYNEDLDALLTSLASCELEPNTAEVLLVFNHGTTADATLKSKHHLQCKQWDNQQLSNGLVVYSVKAFDLPSKHAGVGLARKLGMDLALQRMAAINHDGLIVCLDGDCTVSVNYLERLLTIEATKTNGVSIAFEHDIELIDSQLDKDRIVMYEIFLRYYIQALRYTCYPHSFHTIGSSMAVRASAYAKIGGMNKRKAGEDFYFLHKLMPQGNFVDETECRVFPSARTSERVPFGTGRAMLEMKEGSKSFDQIYNPALFKEIKEWLTLDIAQLALATWPKSIVHFVENYDWLGELQQLKKRSKTKEQWNKNFSYWLDGFKMLKLVHFLRDEYYPNIPIKKACHDLLEIEGEPLDLLRELRRSDGAR